MTYRLVVRPFRGSVQFGDVPGIDLVRACGHELGQDGGGVGGLRAPLAAFPGFAQYPVVGGHRSQVGGLIQQCRPDFGRRGVSEPGAVQDIEDRLPLGRGQGPRLDPVRVRDRGRLHCRRAGPVPPVPGGLRHARGCARRAGADPRRHDGDGLVGHVLDPGSVSAPSEIVSKSACSSVCTPATKRALASSCSSLAFSFRSRAICASRGSAAGRPRGALSPASAPASVPAATR
jgi:hypothetical protein